MEDYREFKFWLVETKASGKSWRIQFPGGHKTPPFDAASAADVKQKIDEIIKQAGE